MNTYSDTFPNKIRISGNKVYLVEIENVITHEKIDEYDNDSIIYEYTEHVVAMQPRDNLLAYVESNFKKLLNYAKNNPYIEKVPLSTEEYILKLENENKSLSEAVDLLIIDTLGGV